MAKYNKLEQKAHLIARIVVEGDGRARQKLDYYGSPMNHPRLRIQTFIRRYTNLFVTEAYRHSPDLIATDMYGDPTLFWVILRYNAIINPLDPVNGVVPGRTLRIPSLQDVSKWLAAVESTNLPTILNGSNNKTSLVTI